MRPPRLALLLGLLALVAGLAGCLSDDADDLDADAAEDAPDPRGGNRSGQAFPDANASDGDAGGAEDDDDQAEPSLAVLG
jgi:hypothetical protein